MLLVQAAMAVAAVMRDAVGALGMV